MRKQIIGGIALILGAAVMPMTAEALNPTTVTCPGDSIQVAIDSGFDEITVNGTCTENVLIRQDDITIQGDGGDDTIEGQVSIDGAQRTRVQELTITGGPEHGITAANGAVFTAVNLLIENVPGVGVIVTSNSTGEVSAVTIRGAGAGVVVEGSAKVVVNNGSLIEQLGGTGVIALGGAAAYLHQVTVREASEGVRATEHSYVEVLFGSLIEDNGGHGIAVDLGSTGNVADATIQNNGGSGVVVDNGSTALITVREAATTSILGNAGNGVHVNQGSSATVTNSTIANNGADCGVCADRGSTVTLVSDTISGSLEGVNVSLNSFGFLEGNTISSTTADDSAALGVLWGGTARLRGGNTLTSDGWAAYSQQGSTLLQHGGHDTLSGRIQVTIDSNAEFRNVEITGPVEISDQSIVIIRDRSGISGNVSVTGSTSVSRDSGLNFVKSGSEQKVKVHGNINCADKESSLSAPPSNVMISGNTNCTGYN